MRPALVVLMLTAAVGPTGVVAAANCDYDKEALLALSESDFDQDLTGGGGGWRAVAGVPGCETAAADLLAAYRGRHPGPPSILAWHEGQLRAVSGQYDRAIPLLDSFRKSAKDDVAGWNSYVDATIAFLKGDRAALEEARARLATTQHPGTDILPPLKDGFIEFPGPTGQAPIRVRWPPNIDVVDGLVACFGKPYAQAYGASCRTQEH